MFFKSLYIKINLTILIVFIVVISFFAASMQKRLEEDATNLTKNQAKYLTAMLKRNIMVDMLGFCERGVQNIVERTGEIPSVEVVRIFDNEGIIKYSVNPKEIGKSLRKLDAKASEVARESGEERYAPFEDEETVYRSFCIIEDIDNQKECQECHGTESEVIATINLCMTMEVAEQHIARNQKINLYNTIVTIVIVTLVLSILLSLLVNRPIKKLLKTMTDAEKGNLHARVKVTTSDELGILANQFNSMLTKLEKADKDIKKYHQEQMLRVDRLATVGEMAAGIAHEIKNPLAGLAGATQILSKEFPADDQRRGITEEMLKLINRLDKIIKDLLTFSRKTEPELIVSSINEEIEKVLFFVTKQAEKSNIVINKELNEEIPRILMDPDRIQQVFLNIVLNALQAMTHGGTLHISTNMEIVEVESDDILIPGVYVVSSFKDSGVGIPEDILQRIFKPLFTTKNQGTGLGLSISQKIIEEHRGKIIVESKEDIGTIFKVYLPKRYS